MHVRELAPPKMLAKSKTGIHGLDEITYGGLPQGRSTLIAGGPGCGKTLLGIEYLVRGATEFNEPGVFVAFEETAEELQNNVASLGFDLDVLIARGQLLIDHVLVERSEIEESGEYDLDGLFIRLGYAIDSIGAKRVVLDTLETLFAALPNEFILRSELQRLFRWLKQKGVTSIITAERGDGALTRHGLEEYVSDCVILLDNRVVDQLTTRRLRIVKYRGSHHGTNEYPYLIDEHGISVLPITSLSLNHSVSSERISSGIPQLDEMLGGKGYFRGSSILVSGTAGAGKSSVAAQFADATCRRGERCLYFAFEESVDQVVRNMGSIGLDLKQWIDQGLLRISASRSTVSGLEMHLVTMNRLIDEFQPQAIILDPITNFTIVGSLAETKAMLTRLIDLLKSRGITALFTGLALGGAFVEQNDIGLSSLVDTWLIVRDVETNGERNRGLHIPKSRGMAHSNQIHEFILTDHGIELVDVYLGPSGTLTGSARVSQKALDRAELLLHQQEIEQRKLLVEGRNSALVAQIAALQAELGAGAQELNQALFDENLRVQNLETEQTALARSRRTTLTGQSTSQHAPDSSN